MAKHGKETFLDYDEKNDILYIYQKGKFKGNVEIGDFVLDIDVNKRVMGIEILNASENLKSLNITKDMLAKVKNASLKTLYKKDSILVGLVLSLPQNIEKPAMIALPALR